MILKIAEIILNYIVLAWLLMISYLTHPHSINMDGLPYGINDQYGTAYLVRVTITIIFSILIVIRLIKPLHIFRIISIVIILITITLTFGLHADFHVVDEWIRKIMFGPI